MTTRRVFLVALLATVLLSGVALAAAATTSGYVVSWFTVEGGGGSSSGGQYALSATAGQPDAGTLAGSGYTVQGGFWVGGIVRPNLYLPLVRR